MPSAAWDRASAARRANRVSKGKEGGDSQAGDGEDGLGEADNAMGDASGKLGEGNADGAVDLQGKALDALRKGAQSLAEAMQQGEGARATARAIAPADSRAAAIKAIRWGGRCTGVNSATI